jgi:hypothetical protein
MSADFSPIMASVKKEAAHDAGEVKDEPRELICESFFQFGWKKKLILFLVFLIVCSTMFINDVVGKINASFVSSTTATTNGGTVVQGIFLVLIYSLMETLVNSKTI